MTPALSLRRRCGLVLLRYRLGVVVGFAAVTVAMMALAARLGIDSDFKKTIPLHHPIIETFLRHAPEFGGGNRVAVALIDTRGDIFNASFFNTLRSVTDEMMGIKGIDPTRVKSIFSPGVRYIDIVEDGFDGSAVIPAGFEPSPDGFREVRDNIVKSGTLGYLVSKDFRAAMVTAQVAAQDPDTGGPLDVVAVARALEDRVRKPFQKDGITVHILGLPTLVAEIMDKGKRGMVYFVITVLLMTVVVFVHIRSAALTLVTLGCAGASVVWSLGFMKLTGLGLGPISAVMVFLLFAIAVSHAILNINSFLTELSTAQDGQAASLASAEKMFFPGLTALLTDSLGFASVAIIPIPVVRDVALGANLGVFSIALVNLFLLPTLLSWFPSRWAVGGRTATSPDRAGAGWGCWEYFSSPRGARIALWIGALALAAAVWIGKGVPIGDTRSGAPELRPGALYNRDIEAWRQHFSLGGDVLVVYAESDEDATIDRHRLGLVDQFTSYIQSQPDVLSAMSLGSWARRAFVVYNEGNPKWYALPSDEENLKVTTGDATSDIGLTNFEGTVLPIYVFVKDHTAQAISRLVDSLERFAADHPQDDIRLRLGGGNIALEAAVNDVLRTSQVPMFVLFYGVAALIVFAFFMSWRSVVCVVAPLALVSVSSYAFMAITGIGLKVATLPIAAVGAGVGMDYAVYLLGAMQGFMRKGMDAGSAFRETLRTTGKAVFFTAAALSVGTGVWIVSGLQLQADMGILLAFTFIANLLAVLILFPALARVLLKTERR